MSRDASQNEASNSDSSNTDAPNGDGSNTDGPNSDATSADGATTNPLGLDPPMGWSSWSFIRRNPTETSIRAQAQGLHDSGLFAHGYIFVNIDDFYYLDPKTTVDAYGRWVVDAQKFPSGMAALGTFIHSLGLKFGLYLTPGIPVAAVNQNTPIEGTTYHAADIAITSQGENNYNFGINDNATVMYYIDYSKPGSQEFLNSWAKLLASYGVDYVKLDGAGTFDMPDIAAWSRALKSTGRAIHFELSNNLDFSYASTWETLSNGWRIDGDIECYCSSTGFGGSGPDTYPLTRWSNVASRFGDARPWWPFSAPGARSDLDSLELGNGDNDGITPDERKAHMSLWALNAAPLLLGTDVTNLDPGDLALLTNDEVIAVDQAGIEAVQISGGDAQVWAARQPDGSSFVGLFNLGASAAPVTVKWTDLGINGSAKVRDLWARADVGSFTGSYQATVNSHGVMLVRIEPAGGGTDAGVVADAGEDSGPRAIFGPTCPPGTVYTEPFASDPIADGTFLSNEGPFVYNMANTLSLQTGNPNTQVWIGARPLWTNYTVSVPIRLDTAGGNAGINFRIEYAPDQGQNNSGYMYFAGIDSKSVQLGLETGGNGNNWIQLANNTAANFALGTFYTVQISVSGSSIKVNVDGVNYVSLDDSTLSFGAIGLRTWASSATYGTITVTCN